MEYKECYPWVLDGDAVTKIKHIFSVGDAIEIHDPIGNDHTLGSTGKITQDLGRGDWLVRLDDGHEIRVSDYEIRPADFKTPKKIA